MRTMKRFWRTLSHRTFDTRTFLTNTDLLPNRIKSFPLIRIRRMFGIELPMNFPGCIVTFQTNTVFSVNGADAESPIGGVRIPGTKKETGRFRGVHRQPLNHVQSAIFTYFFFLFFFLSQEACDQASQPDQMRCNLSNVPPNAFFPIMMEFPIRFRDSVRSMMERTSWIYRKPFSANEQINK